MNKEEREEFKELFNISLLAHTNHITGKIDVLNTNVSQINTRLDTLNGKVLKQAEEIQTLHDAEVGRKSIRKFIFIGSAIMASIVGVIVLIVELIIK